MFDAVCEQELEGVVAKRLNERYRPGERSWVKTKNRDYWRFESEREGALKISRQRRAATSASLPATTAADGNAGVVAAHHRPHHVSQ